MAGAKLPKTRWPGIYHRGDRYVVVYRDQDGKQRRETARHTRGRPCDQAAPGEQRDERRRAADFR